MQGCGNWLQRIRRCKSAQHTELTMMTFWHRLTTTTTGRLEPSHFYNQEWYDHVHKDVRSVSLTCGFASVRAGGDTRNHGGRKRAREGESHIIALKLTSCLSQSNLARHNITKTYWIFKLSVGNFKLRAFTSGNVVRSY